jgi:hypothetical protein
VRIGPPGSGSRQLRALLAREKPLLALGAFNAVSARIVEAAGFPVVYLSGYHSVLALLGMPDAGLATATEMLQNARQVHPDPGPPARPVRRDPGRRPVDGPGRSVSPLAADPRGAPPALGRVA